MRWDAWVAERNAEIRAAHRNRTIRDLAGAGPVTELAATGRQVISFASNDYLGLSRHPTVIAAAHDALDRLGTGSGASRLVVGARPVHRELETALAVANHTDRALLFPTGYMANIGLLSALAGEDVTIHSDELNHASIIDGARLARADVAVYPHLDLDHLDQDLRRARAARRRSLVVTDWVFSMDGDVAPVHELHRLCERYEALLVVDAAHAVLEDGASLGPGAVVVGTLSKTLGALGGYVAGPAGYVDLLVSTARPFIFTTAPSPADTAAALAALRIVHSAEGEALRGRLRRHIDRVAPGHRSPILPVIIGEEAAALAASQALLDRGLLVPAIRPPTVAPGTSRLRVALSAAHRGEDVERLLDALESIGHWPARAGRR